MVRRPPRSTLFPTRRSSDLAKVMEITAAHREFWSVRPIAKVAVPSVKATTWPKTDIDRFILARLEKDGRSEEHTSELQSLAYLVCRLLLEKKKKTASETHRI